MQTKPKKILGQNFLQDQNIQRKIIDACDFQSSDRVLEIGAGTGIMTGLIASNVSRVYALEIDRSLNSLLTRNLKAYSNISIINKDILKFDIEQIKDNVSRRIKVFGNIPYYITTPIIEHLLRFRYKIEVIFLSVQKEFAQRMVAQPGAKNYGSFSCFIQYYTEPKILFSIKKNSFYPVPKVDSSFLRLRIRQNPALAVNNEEMFFRIIRTAFQQRRKTLKNSLKDIVPKEKLQEFFGKYKINPKIRPQDLSLQDFANLTNIRDAF
jgi:16S rRNA (adenine1518-N6/adenine1519-N6)-dimethyltransferase